MEKEKEFLISQRENLKTPFYYEYADGWKALLDSQYLPTLMTLLVVILGALAVGIFWMSMYNWTYLQKYFYVTIGGYVGVMFIIFLAMVVSALTRSTVIAVVIPFALSCTPMFLGRIPVLTRIVTFFPDMLLRICIYHDEFLLCEIGGKVMGVFTLLIPLYLTLCIVIVQILYRILERTDLTEEQSASIKGVWEEMNRRNSDEGFHTIEGLRKEIEIIDTILHKGAYPAVLERGLKESKNQLQNNQFDLRLLCDVK